MSLSTISNASSNSRANVTTRTGGRRSTNNASHHNNNNDSNNETLPCNPSNSSRNLPLPSSFVDNTGHSYRSASSGFTTPKSEMPVPVFHVQSRVPQSFDGKRF